MSPRTLISIDFLVCGMLFPLSTSISVSHQLNPVSNFSSEIILSTTLILTIHVPCISSVLVTNVFVLKVTLLSNCVVSVTHFLPFCCT